MSGESEDNLLGWQLYCHPSVFSDSSGWQYNCHPNEILSRDRVRSFRSQLSTLHSRLSTLHSPLSTLGLLLGGRTIGPGFRPSTGIGKLTFGSAIFSSRQSAERLVQHRTGQRGRVVDVVDAVGRAEEAKIVLGTRRAGRRSRLFRSGLSLADSSASRARATADSMSSSAFFIAGLIRFEPVGGGAVVAHRTHLGRGLPEHGPRAGNLPLPMAGAALERGR